MEHSVLLETRKHASKSPTKHRSRSDLAGACDQLVRAAHIERRMKEGRTKREAIRCLKRYVAREVFTALPRSALALDNP
jgi:hypothetical protein